MKGKPYLYVDETGQDTAGALFIVGVVVVSLESRDALADRLATIEQSTHKGRRKWKKSEPARRLAYMRAVLRELAPLFRLFYGVHYSTRDYTTATASTAAAVLELVAAGDDRATVLVDALSAERQKEIGVMLRRRKVRADVRGIKRDESNPLIRLADAIAGFVRDALEGGAEESKLWKQALKAGQLRDVADEE